MIDFEFDDEEYYKKLDKKQATELALKVFHLTNEESVIQDILFHLLIYTKADISDLYPKLLEEKWFSPDFLYKDADDSVAEHIIRLVESENESPHIHQLLVSLSWIETEKVVSFFDIARKNDLIWKNKLMKHIESPDVFTEYAGWTLNKNGRRVDLVQKSNVLGLASPEYIKEHYPNSEVDEDFTCFTKTTEKCPNCKQKFTIFFTDRINNKEVDICTCLQCSCYNEGVFIIIGKNNEKIWHPKNTNEPSKPNWIEIRTNTLKLLKKPKPLLHTLSEYGSSIGGYPLWEQDANYLKCPDCQTTMHYVAQFTYADINNGEGFHYFHYCEDCNVVGCNYQQT